MRNFRRRGLFATSATALIMAAAAVSPVAAAPDPLAQAAAVKPDAVQRHLRALQKIAERPDVMLVDYHLHDRMDGLDALVALRGAAGRPLPGALLTADGRDELKRLARERGYRVLTKPVKPASLRAFLTAWR